MDEIKLSLHQDDEASLIEALQTCPNVLDLAATLANEGVHLVTEACKRGYLDVLQVLTEQGVPLTDSSYPESAVQTACRYNRPAVLEYVLAREDQILPDGVQVWHAKSPFYIASQCGHAEIVDKLLDYSPSLVKGEGVRSCLMYAACLGGSLAVVKRWMVPSMDINHPLRLLESFTDCENKTPLFAACSGGHKNVVEFLLDNYPCLQLTAAVCNQYPDILAEVLHTHFIPQDDGDDELFQLYVCKMRRRNLFCLHPRWLLPYSVTLVEINVSDNFLEELPSCLPWKFQNLRILRADNNAIKALSSPKLSGTEEFCPSLEEVHLSHNQLRHVSPQIFQLPSLKALILPHNLLDYLIRSMHQYGDEQIDSDTTLRRQSVMPPEWCCPSLSKLDVSHNHLQMLPQEMKACTGLVSLVANNNKLTTIPQPWECPLFALNVSHNQLERFPVNVEEYWCGSLKYLNISHNCLDELNEGILKLSVLIDLDASHNKIERLPSPQVWECGHLHNLNLKHNQLGKAGGVVSPKGIDLKFSLPVIRSKRRLSMMEDSRQLTFPPLFTNCLNELRLSHNGLTCVPPSIADLKSLEILDLSHNPLIRTLPRELGKLRHCGNLKLNGMTLDNVPADYNTSKGNNTKQLLAGFLESLRECKEYHKLKVIVLGKKDKGKTSVVNLLAGSKEQITPSVVTRREIKLHGRKGSFSFLSEKPSLCLSVWDMAGDEEYQVAYTSLFSPCSLYLLVWDFWRVPAELDQIAQWVYNIQASTPHCKVILVGTFLDKIQMKADDKKAAIDAMQDTVYEKLRQLEEPLDLCAVSCSNNEGFDQLKSKILEKAKSMKIPGKKYEKLIGRKVPKSYLLLESLMADELAARKKANKPPFLTKVEFDDLFEKIDAKHNDITTPAECHSVTKFLIETGSLLHYTDQLGALNMLYFLDPAWLVDILVKVFMSPEGKKKLVNGKGKLSLTEVEKLYLSDERFPPDYVDQYLQLLERFDIAVPVNSAHNLLFPSMLPDKPPMSEVPGISGQCQMVRRLYRMAELPRGFWTRLLTHVMARVEQFSTHDWFHKPTKSRSFRNISIKPSLNLGRYNPSRNGSMYGLHIKQPVKIFCQEWISVQHDDGYFCIEPISYDPRDGQETLPRGLLITEQSKDGDFAIMGIIVDEIEDILHDFYPGLIEPDEQTMQPRLERYALCPSCYDGSPPRSELNHFTVEHCARMLMSGDTITCVDGGIKHHLQDLVPDMLLGELPEKFFLDNSKLRFDETPDTFLGRGVTGSVFRGSYGDVDVAVKLYRSDIRNTVRDNAIEGSTTSTSSDSGTATLSSKGSLDTNVFIEDDGPTEYVNFDRCTTPLDLDEEESMKSFRALREMRQEVSLTSRLQHPCIVALIGLAFSPKLLMVMELAPLGTLRGILDQHLGLRPVFNKHRDREKVFPLILNKWLTFKIIYQIAKGLEYLHTSGIIYKDLKSDNILAISTSVTDAVNVKLSDYGISKYCWSGSSVGLVGTPGYQAPEILDGLAYDEKVDVFSFAMVIYEVLTGRRPYEEYENMSQISKALKNDDKRPNIQDFNVHSRFPYLEYTMKQCWQKDAAKRPSASTVVSKSCMQNTEFISQAAMLKMADKQTFAIDSVLTASCHDAGQMLLWLWEGDKEHRCVSVLDMETAGFRYYKHRARGPKVTCMSRVGKYIWVGTKAGEVEIFGFEHSDLTTISTIQLGAVPVQIETFVDQPPARGTSIIIALENSQINLYQPRPSKGPHVRRQTLKTTQGFKEPKTVTLRSEQLYCLQLTDQSGDIWVSVDGYIDIVDRHNFKVVTDNRINLEILSKMCDIPDNLNVSQMCCSTNIVHCLMCKSPFVLGFCETTYNCLNVINCGGTNIYRSIVGKELNLSDSDHKAYHGQFTGRHTGHTRSKSESDLLDDSDSVVPVSCSGNHRTQSEDILNTSEHTRSRSNTSSGSTEQVYLRSNTDQTHDKSVIGESTSSQDTVTNVSITVEDSENPCAGNRRKQIISKCLPVVDDAQPDLPPKPGIPENTAANVPPVQAIPQRPSSSVPRIPPRSPFLKVNGKGNKATDLYTYPPQVPPRKFKRVPRPVTNQFQSSEDASINRSKLGPRSSESLPNMYQTRTVSSSDFDIILSSIVRIGNSLWIGRSHGDICVINADATSEQFGKVYAVMRDLARKNRGFQMEEGVTLVKVGDYIASATLLQSEAESYCEVASWEKYDVTDIRKMDRFWSDIVYIEQTLASQSAKIEQQNVSLLHVGDF